jgi:hypothetical protein
MFGTDLIICLEHFLITFDDQCIPDQNGNQSKKDIGHFHQQAPAIGFTFTASVLKPVTS